MDRQAWCYVCGLVSALEERLLGRRDVLALIETGGGEERRARLRASVLFPDTPPAGDLADVVHEAYREFVRGVAAVSPDARIGDLFLAEDDWRAFREFAKAQILEGASDTSGPVRGKRQASRFDAAWRGEIEDEALRPFAEAAAVIQAECPSEGDRAGWIDLCLDAREAFGLAATADALGSPALSDWVRTWTTLLGALSILRAVQTERPTDSVLLPWRRAGFGHPALLALSVAPEGEWPILLDRLGLPNAERGLADSEKTVRLARLMDERVAELASAASGEPFGPERVFAFLWGVKMEAANLRQALLASEYGIPQERIAEELRAAR